MGRLDEGCGPMTEEVNHDSFPPAHWRARPRNEASATRLTGWVPHPQSRGFASPAHTGFAFIDRGSDDPVERNRVAPATPLPGCTRPKRAYVRLRTGRHRPAEARTDSGADGRSWPSGVSRTSTPSAASSSRRASEAAKSRAARAAARRSSSSAAPSGNGASWGGAAPRSRPSTRSKSSSSARRCASVRSAVDATSWAIARPAAWRGHRRSHRRSARGSPAIGSSESCTEASGPDAARRRRARPEAAACIASAVKSSLER